MNSKQKHGLENHYQKKVGNAGSQGTGDHESPSTLKLVTLTSLMAFTLTFLAHAGAKPHGRDGAGFDWIASASALRSANATGSGGAHGVRLVAVLVVLGCGMILLRRRRDEDDAEQGGAQHQ